MTAHDQTLHSNAINVKIDKQDSDATYRMCKTKEETMQHTLRVNAARSTRGDMIKLLELYTGVSVTSAVYIVHNNGTNTQLSR